MLDSCTLCAVLALASAVLFVAYLATTFVRYGYIVSPFNVIMFLAAVAFCLSPFFYLEDGTWASVWIYDAASMRAYLAQSLNINLLGTVVFLGFLLFKTVRERNGGAELGRNRVLNVMPRVDARVAGFVTLGSIAVFAAICLIFNRGTFPLLNGDRDFYYQSSISPVYQAMLFAMQFMGVYYGFRFVSQRRGLLGFLAVLFFQLLSGTRGGMLQYTLAPVLVYAISYPYQVLRAGRPVERRGLVRRWSTLLIGVACVGVLVLGLEIQTVRSGEGLGGIARMAQEVVDGNTFSDIRDGAFLLKGFAERTDSSFVQGLTYLAGLLGFVPSSLSAFRQTWSWGRFSAHTLAGIRQTHFGLRGGWFLESYFNFGILGILALALVLGLLMFKSEQIYRRFILGRGGRGGIVHPAADASLLLVLVRTLFSALTCSSGTIELYACLATMCLLVGGSHWVRHLRASRAEQVAGTAMSICLMGGDEPGVRCGVTDYSRRLAQELRLEGTRVLEVVRGGSGGVGFGADGCLRLSGGWKNPIALALTLIGAKRAGCNVVHVEYPTVAYGRSLGISLVGWMVRFLGLSFVYTAHEFSSYGPLGHVRQLPSLYAADAVVAVDEQERDAILEYLPAGAEVHLIHIGSNISRFAGSASDVQQLRASLAGPGTTVAAFFGFVLPSKHFHEILRAMAELKGSERLSTKLLLVGELDPANGYQAEALNLIKGLGLTDDVITTGYLPAENVGLYLRAADYALLPTDHGASVRNGSFLAAYQEGIEVVTSAPKGDFPFHDVRFLDTNDVEGIKKAIVAEQKREIPRYDRDVDFGWKRVARSHANLYQEVLDH